MMNKKILISLLIIIIILAAIILIGIFYFPKFFRLQEVKITTDKTNYESEGGLKVNIENNLDKKICFSSCYPYYLERQKEGGWKEYAYLNCSNPDLVDKCIDSGKVRAFSILLPSVKEGSHRLAIPVCFICETGSDFKEESKFYSNEFIIR